MPTFLVTDPQSGRKVRLTGDSAPTEQELEKIFSDLPPLQPQAGPEAQASDTQQPAQTQAADTALPEISPFPEEREETRAAQELPELGSGGILSGEDTLKKTAIAPLLLATTDTQEIADILTSNFDNIGISQDPGGNLLARNNETGAQIILNKPGLSKLDLMQGLGIAATFTPAGRIGALGKTVAQKVVAGAGASGVTQIGIEVMQKLFGGDINEDEIAIASALGGVAETVVPAIQALRQSRQAKQQAKQLDVPKAQIAETVETIKPARAAQAGLEQATGVKVPLFQAQQTMQPSTLLKQRLVPQLDAGSRKAAKELESQNRQAFEATSELINTIAPEAVAATGAKRFKTAAQKSIDAAKATRTAKTSPIFKEALDEGAEVNLRPVTALIDDFAKDAPPGTPFEITANKIRRSIEPIDVVAPSLRQLQKAKFTMDDMIENVGGNALGNEIKREVVLIKKSLVDQMAEASPLYRTANAEFERLSPAVKDLEDSIIGTVSRITDVNLKNVSRRIFDVSESNPQNVLDAKKIIDKVDPGAWNDLMRVEFQRRFSGIETLAEDIPGEVVGNVPAKLRRAIFGNPAQRRTLLAGMDTRQRKNFVYLDDVLRRASSGRQQGSPTAAFTEEIGRLKGVVGQIGDFVTRPLSLAQKTGDALDRATFDSNVSKLADVLFNPKWEPKLKQLRSLSPNSKKAGEIFKELMNAAKATVQTERLAKRD